MRQKPLSALLTASAVAAVLSGGAVMPAIAQETVTPPASAEGQTIDQEQVKAFAAASLAVQEVAQRWNPQIEGAESQQQAEEMRNSATQEMVVAIQQSGLDVGTYTQIFEVAQSDPTLAQQIAREQRALQ